MTYFRISYRPQSGSTEYPQNLSMENILHDCAELGTAHTLWLNDLFPYPNAYAGQRVFVLGGGPSLKGFDFSQLDGQIVLGANRAFEQAQTCMAISMDTRFYGWVINGVLGTDALEKWGDFYGPKVFTLRPTNCELFPERIWRVNKPIQNHKYPPTLKRGIGDSYSSGHAAMMIAWAMGAKEIVLLGLDMNGDGNGLQEWHHEAYPKVQKDACYTVMLRDFERTFNPMVMDGVNVINMVDPQRPSRIPHWEQRPLAELNTVLPRKSMPVCYGYYTEGTDYYAEAKLMRMSCRAFGLEAHILPVENQGSWQANTLYKPKAVLQALNHAGGRPILFLDCDARMRAFPALFDGFEAEVGYSVFDWAEIGGRRSKAQEVSSAVLYLKDTPGVREFLHRWIEACDKMGLENDQTRMGNVLLPMIEGGLSAQRIPHSYNQIFDSMGHLGNPIIEQMQASRRLKQIINTGETQ